MGMEAETFGDHHDDDGGGGDGDDSVGTFRSDGHEVQWYLWKIECVVARGFVTL